MSDLASGRFSAALTDVEQPLPAVETGRPVVDRETPRETSALWSDLTPPYSTIVADPPWMYQKNPGEKTGSVMASMAEGQYSTMTNEEIVALPVADLAAEQAHLYLWITNPGMFGGRFSHIDGRDICEAWGFRYVTLLTWVKPGAGGMGWYFRGQTEHVIFGTRGDLGIPTDIRRPNVITASRSGHSRKPDHFFDLVEAVSPGPYVELFSRDPRLGWDSWGHGYEIRRAEAAS